MMTSQYDMARVDQMEGHEFERFIADMLYKLGYRKVEVTRGSGDQGVDVLAEKEGIRYAVQCKCYSSDLGNTPVQEVNAGKMIYHCHVGVVVTNRYFTSGAKEAAKATGVLLWDRTKLQELIMQAEALSRATSNADALLRRGFMSLEISEWDKADSFFERVLNLDAECGDAYLGKVLAATRSISLEDLREKTIQLNDFKDFSFAIRFSSGTRLQALQETKELLQQRWRAKEEKDRQQREAEERRRQEERQRREAEERRRQEEERQRREAEERRRQEAERQRREAEERRRQEEERQRREAEERRRQEAERQRRETEAWKARVAPYWKPLREQCMIAVGTGYTLGVKSDGTVVITSPHHIPELKDIVAVTTDADFAVGLKADGKVIKIEHTSGALRYFKIQNDFPDWSWRNIIAVSAGDYNLVGLRTDGTVVAKGFLSTRDELYTDVYRWKNIVMVAAGEDYIVGLKSDGTVAIVYRNYLGQKSNGTVVIAYRLYFDCHDEPSRKYDVSSWTDIVAIAAGWHHILGLKSDGTVVAVGENEHGECNVSSWKEIVAVSAARGYTVGLRSDGTVVATGSNDHGQCNVSNWKNIVAIAAGNGETVGLKADGTVVTVGFDGDGQRNVSGWKLFDSIESWAHTRKQQRRARLEQEKSFLQLKLNNLGGLFVARRRRKIEARLEEIEKELRDL